MISKLASVSSLLKAGTIAGAAVAVTITGMPAIQKAFAEPVKIQAQAVPGFADVVAAVTPAVVSVRVQSRARATSTNGSQCVGIAAWKNATVKPVAATVVRTVDCMAER